MYVFGTNFVKSILKTVQRGNCNYQDLQAVPRIDYMVTEVVVASSCATVCLFEFERMASGDSVSHGRRPWLMVYISWVYL